MFPKRILTSSKSLSVDDNSSPLQQKFVSIPSAVFQMLCLGFGVAVIFGIMLGRAYSSKQWKLLDFIIVIAIFYAVDLITKATVSHWVLDAIQPQAAELFDLPVVVVKMVSDVPEEGDNEFSYDEFVNSHSDFGVFVDYLETLR